MLLILTTFAHVLVEFDRSAGLSRIVLRRYADGGPGTREDNVTACRPLDGEQVVWRGASKPLEPDGGNEDILYGQSRTR